MGLFRYIAILISFFASQSVAATSLSVWIDSQIYTLELTNHTPAGLNPSAGAQHFRGAIAGIDNSWARISKIDNHWEGVVSVNGELHLIDLATSPVSSRSLQATVIKATPAADFDQLGACQLMHPSDAGETSNPNRVNTSFSAMQLSAPTPVAASFNSLCANTVDGVCLLAEIDFVFDEDFQDTFPSNFENRATQMINIMEGYYLNDFNIAFQSLSTTFLDSQVFSSTTNSLDLLEDLSQRKRDNQLSFSSKDEAIMMLVSGREFDGDTVGIAWLEGLCDSSGYFSTNTVQVVNSNISLTALVGAHELGHNLGAGHDGSGNSCGAGFIMAPSLNPLASEFSSCSVAYIEDAIGDVNNQDSCFDYPFDIEIDETNSANTLATASVTRTFDISADIASENISQATISGNITNGEGNITQVTIDGDNCTIIGDGQSYNCTLSSPSSSHELAVTLAVIDDSYTISHTVAVSQSQLVETDTTNNSVSDSFTVLIDPDAEDPPVVEDPVEPPPDPDPVPNEDSEVTDDSQESNSQQSGDEDENEASADSGSSGGGGGSLGFLTLLLLAMLGIRNNKPL